MINIVGNYGLVFETFALITKQRKVISFIEAANSFSLAAVNKAAT